MRRNAAAVMAMFVGFVFLFAGFSKMFDPTLAVAALESVGFNYDAARVAIGLVTVVEVYIGVLLCWRDMRGQAIPAAILLLAAFAVFLFYLTTLANPPSCGCLGLAGVLESARHEALAGIARNCGLIWLLSSAGAILRKAGALNDSRNSAAAIT